MIGNKQSERLMRIGATRNIVILTGAGISAESGIATFRGPGGLWEGHGVEEKNTPIIAYIARLATTAKQG